MTGSAQVLDVTRPLGFLFYNALSRVNYIPYFLDEYVVITRVILAKDKFILISTFFVTFTF